MIVRENIEFVRGIDPRSSMKIGMEEGIFERFRNLRKIDKDTWIESWYVDPSYSDFYLYLSSRITNAYDPHENTKEENDEVKENIRSQIDELMSKAGLNEYFIYDSHENADEICYIIKPEYKKLFKKIADELNT